MPVIEPLKNKLLLIFEYADKLRKAGVEVELSEDDFRPENIDKTLESLKQAVEEYKVE
jgi:hypothetical protein